MKKLFVLLFLLVLTVGCSSDKSDEVKSFECSRKATVSSNVKTDLQYKVFYKNDYVTKVESVEKIISDDEDTLDTYKSTVEAFYEPYTKIKYYDVDVSIKGDTLTSKATIDYEKIDTDKLIEIDSANGSIINDGKVKVSDIKKMYAQVGAKCE